MKLFFDFFNEHSVTLTQTLVHQARYQESPLTISPKPAMLSAALPPFSATSSQEKFSPGTISSKPSSLYGFVVSNAPTGASSNSSKVTGIIATLSSPSNPICLSTVT
uniref:(northern house mosquito) hypothetical protein n=1 Tax=Culex pipiens TaxID=7175 RepID=A0A8D8G9U3_CULPI